MKFKYETRNAAGQVCCAGNRPDFHRCEKCRTPQPTTAAAPVTATARRPVTRPAPVEDFTPPDPYKAGLDKLRGDTLTPADVAEVARTVDQRSPTDYTAPNPYDAHLALRKIQETER